MRRRFAAAASACLALAGLALAAAPARAEPAMWVVKDADTTIYLMGAIHLLKPGQAWESERMAQVVAGCEDLTLEIADFDDLSAIAPLVGKHGVDLDRPLSARLTDKEKARLAQAAAALGMAPQQFETMKPWLAALSLSMAPLTAAGYDPGAGVEKRLTTDARAAGRPIRGLETAEGQVMMLASMPEEAQLEYLRGALDEFDKAPAELERLAAAWAAGDTAAVERAVNEDVRRDQPGLYRAMFADRNADFARKIKAMLDGKGARCVAVGAGHLTGADSVQAQLRTLGVESVRY